MSRRTNSTQRKKIFIHFPPCVRSAALTGSWPRRISRSAITAPFPIQFLTISPSARHSRSDYCTLALQSSPYLFVFSCSLPLGSFSLEHGGVSMEKVLVVGGTSGLGLEIARAFRRDCKQPDGVIVLGRQ